MKVNPKNTDYQEFLSIISEVETIAKHTILINYEDEIIGNLKQLNEFAKEIKNIDFKRFIFKLNKEVSIQMSDIEVMNYLKLLTNNFDKEFTEKALFELEVFESMVFDEIMVEAVQEKYIEKGLKIPTYERLNHISGKIEIYDNHKVMQNKFFPPLGIQLYFAKQYLQKALPPQQKQNKETRKPIKNLEKEIELSEKIKNLKTIWLPEAKISVEDFIQKGIDKALWNEQLKITIQRKASNYGTNKTLLGNIFIAFKGWAISNHLDYNEAGRIFCEVFNIKIKESTKEKYHCFSSTNNPSQVKAIKTAFNVSKNS